MFTDRESAKQLTVGKVLYDTDFATADNLHRAHGDVIVEVVKEMRRFTRLNDADKK